MVKHLVFAIAITAILSCGQNEPLTNYEPKSPQEQALKSILLDFQDGVNTRDSKKIENLIHEKASIMTGRERKILSKEEYIKILPKRLAENPSIALGKPKIVKEHLPSLLRSLRAGGALIFAQIHYLLLFRVNFQ